MCAEIRPSRARSSEQRRRRPTSRRRSVARRRSSEATANVPACALELAHAAALGPILGVCVGESWTAGCLELRASSARLVAYCPPTHPRRCAGLTGDRRTRFETICLCGVVERGGISLHGACSAHGGLAFLASGACGHHAVNLCYYLMTHHFDLAEGAFKFERLMDGRTQHAAYISSAGRRGKAQRWRCTRASSTQSGAHGRRRAACCITPGATVRGGSSATGTRRSRPRPAWSAPWKAA